MNPKKIRQLLPGRFKAILVQKDSYLLELARYIVLNPVRAKLAESAKEWRRSSYRATAGYEEGAACLTTEWILAGFDKTKNLAQQRYRDFVQAGNGQPSVWQQLKNQIYLSNADFATARQSKLHPERSL